MGSSIHRQGLRALWIFAGLVLHIATAAALPSDADIQRIVAEQVQGLGGETSGVAIVVGAIKPEGRTIIAQGPADGDTAFEIGSVTKVFTALLLADMVERREVQLSDAVAKHLPKAQIPERNGRKITFLDLATHTSSLPFTAPGTGLSDEQRYQFLASYQLPYDVGTLWEYSDLGYWLLAQALTARAGDDYQTLLRTRVIAPLKLRNTTFDAARGGLVSTANDMLQFLSVALGYERSRLSPAIVAMLTTRRPASPNQQALGVLISRSNNEQLIFHDGRTSAIAWDPKQRIGVVVLANRAGGMGDLSRHLLRPDLPLTRPSGTL
jgi:D-alanyl-D-alanine-carboxypeptidase/D-alanyl-D-alanine-endopeptidase